MSDHKGGRAAILLILVGGLGVGSLAYYVKNTPEARRVPDAVRVVRKPEKPEPTATPVVAEAPKPRPAEATKPVETDTVRLPVFGDDLSDMDLAKDETPVPSGDAMKFVADRIVSAAHFDGTRVLAVDVRDHVAFVSFNDAVERGMGSMQEGAFLKAFRIGFGQFTGVDKVSLEAGGHPLESGHIDLNEPMPVIRPGEKAAPEPTPSEG